MNHKDVPYIVYEATQARSERTVKRLIIVVIIAIALIFISNAIWLYAWMQYDYTGTETETIYSQDGEGVNNINTRFSGDFYNGSSNDNPKTDENTQEEKR